MAKHALPCTTSECLVCVRRTKPATVARTHSMGQVRPLHNCKRSCGRGCGGPPVVGHVSFKEIPQYAPGHSTEEAHVPVLCMYLQERSVPGIANVFVHHSKHYLRECELHGIEIAPEYVIVLADGVCVILR